MIISWHGFYTIKITSKGKILVIDPYSPKMGLKPLRINTDIVALSNPSNPDMSHHQSLRNNPRIIDTPGEYSIDHFTLYSFGWHDKDQTEKSIHRWHIEDMVVLHLGDLHRELSNRELEELEYTDIDILFIPFCETKKFNIDIPLKWISLIEPKVIIPINYQFSTATKTLASSKDFIKELGVKAQSPQPKINISKNKLPQDNLNIIQLKP
jgi:L-ascorbate metabolism protein UlaG (beta-lactamase superfamily)